MGRTVRTLLGTGSVYRRTNRDGVELPIWHVQYSVRTSTGPQQVRESAHTTDRDVALELLKQKLGDVAGGRAPDPNRKHVTVKALLAELAAAYKQEKRGSWPNVESAAKIFNEAIGDVRALDVTTHTLHRLVGEWRRQGMTAATCNRRIHILRTAYN